MRNEARYDEAKRSSKAKCRKRGPWYALHHSSSSLDFFDASLGLAAIGINDYSVDQTHTLTHTHKNRREKQKNALRLSKAMNEKKRRSDEEEG